MTRQRFARPWRALTPADVPAWAWHCLSALGLALLFALLVRP